MLNMHKQAKKNYICCCCCCVTERRKKNIKKIMKCKCNERKQIFPQCTGFRPIMQKYNLWQNFLHLNIIFQKVCKKISFKVFFLVQCKSFFFQWIYNKKNSFFTQKNQYNFFRGIKNYFCMCIYKLGLKKYIYFMVYLCQLEECQRLWLQFNYFNEMLKFRRFSFQYPNL